jgi:hypothetical protein
VLAPPGLFASGEWKLPETWPNFSAKL